jgi:hypothetical protein
MPGLRHSRPRADIPYRQRNDQRRLEMSSAAVETLFTDDAKAESPAPSSNGGTSVGSADPVDPFLARLDRMSSRQRIEAYRSGAFTREERTIWACRYPEEVPLVNDEFEWLVLGSADLA